MFPRLDLSCRAVAIESGGQSSGFLHGPAGTELLQCLASAGTAADGVSFAVSHQAGAGAEFDSAVTRADADLTLVFTADAVTLAQAREMSACIPIWTGQERVHDGWMASELLRDCRAGTTPRALLAVSSARFLQRVAAAQDDAVCEFRASLDAGGRLLLVGAGTIGRQVLALARRAEVPVAAFVDNRLAGQFLSGIPVIAPGQMDPARDVAVLTVGRGTGVLVDQMESLGVRKVSGLARFCRVLGLPDLPESGYLHEFRLHAGRLVALWSRLGDARSRQVLEAVIRHRLALDEGELSAVVSSSQPQWFEGPFFEPSPGQVFVDGGAYDGDTLRGFIAANGAEFAAAYAFEPDAELARRAAGHFAGDPRVEVFAEALSDRIGASAFSQTERTDGRLAEGTATGSTAVGTTTIDASVARPATFIKLDVEGNEAKALQGAAHQIRHHRPRLAIALYHRPEDLWRIPALLDDIASGYRLFMRHYTDVSFETVLYAAP